MQTAACRWSRRRQPSRCSPSPSGGTLRGGAGLCGGDHGGQVNSRRQCAPLFLPLVVPHDPDGDGRGDLAVWRPTDGTFWARSPSGLTTRRPAEAGARRRRATPFLGDVDGMLPRSDRLARMGPGSGSPLRRGNPRRRRIQTMGFGAPVTCRWSATWTAMAGRIRSSGVDQRHVLLAHVEQWITSAQHSVGQRESGR